MASEIRDQLNPGPREWARIQAIFEAVAQAPMEQRAETLLALCEGDEELRRDVESLLEGHEDSEGVLSRAVTQGGVAEQELDLPYMVGAYRLTEKVGSGGMGAVYRAECDGGQPEKQVAVKIMAGCGAGPHVEERFRKERQILARLDHPLIARLMDGGVTADGRQYIVMEYVDGSRIDRYARKKRLDVQGKVRLFEKVCVAVAYAHENGVVHRDIKPNNLLVAADGTPKLLDFGISKLREAGFFRSAETTPGEESTKALTPEYASPEQLLGEPATPASDVYSLGMLLYKLLTGHRPDNSPFVEQSVEAPSELAKRQKGAAPISADLDAIVMRALARDPGARYVSARELKEDLERLLNDRPVAARSHALLPRVARFVGRRR
jgi:serine/threonine protein kinase